MNCEPSVEGINVWFLLSLISLAKMIVAVETQVSDKCFNLCIVRCVTFVAVLLVKFVSEFSLRVLSVLLTSLLYAAGSCWHQFSGVCSNYTSSDDHSHRLLILLGSNHLQQDYKIMLRLKNKVLRLLVSYTVPLFSVLIFS